MYILYYVHSDNYQILILKEKTEILILKYNIAMCGINELYKKIIVYIFLDDAT